MPRERTRHSDSRRIRYAASLKGGWAEFSKNRLAVLGLAIIGVFCVLAFVHPILMGRVWPTGVYNPLTGYDPDVIHPSSPSGTHLLGTDWLGRDVMSQMLAGTRPTVILAISAAVTTAVVATVVAAIGGYFRGVLDSMLSRFSDAMLLLPAPIFMVVIGSGEFSQKIGPVRFGVIYGLLTGLGAGAIVLRSQALKIMASPYVDAARSAGGTDWWIIRKHLLPHLYPLAVLYMMLAVVGAVVSEAFASWFGQTAQRMTWGTIVYYGVTFREPITGTITWHTILPPAIALSVFAASFYLVSVGLRDSADPRTKSVRRTVA